MNYAKPKVAVLGEAVCVIENMVANKPGYSVFDSGQAYHLPAYDLDE